MSALSLPRPEKIVEWNRDFLSDKYPVGGELPLMSEARKK
jgi:hypothetical protein